MYNTWPQPILYALKIISPKSDSLICKQRQKIVAKYKVYKKVLLRLQIGLYKTCLNKQKLLKHIKLIPVTNGLVFFQ